MSAAVWLQTLAAGDVTLGALPATVADTDAFLVLAVSAAQHRAGRWGGRVHTLMLAPSTHIMWKEPLIQNPDDVNTAVEFQVQ